MEIEASRQDLLSQSYAECVERVAQQKNNDDFQFQLPKDVLDDREKVWDDFFHKYNRQVPNAVELDIDTLAPVEIAGKSTSDGDDEEAADVDEEEEEEGEEEEEEEEDEKEYYTKCRAPLRKVPALIQYWIDTGNPPYQLVGGDDHSETGSSLIEGDHSREGHSAILRDSSEIQRKSSRCSSVDTAAYILSNKNRTNRPESQLLVAKSSISAENSSQMCKNAFNLPERLKNGEKVAPAEISGSGHPESTRTPEKASIFPVFSSNSRVSGKPEVASPGQQSVKLSEILPDLQEFEELFEVSKNPLSFLRRKPGNVSLAKNRRRLYTGRDSPVDLVDAKPHDDVARDSLRTSHPALQSEPENDGKARKIAARARAAGKRKRARKAAENRNNSSQESGNDPRALKSDEKYRDFFESLGLTPRRMIGPKSRRNQPKRVALPRDAKNVEPINDSLESSAKESSQNSGFSPPNINTYAENNKKQGKVLYVRIERLSDELLAKYRSKKQSPSPNTDDYESNFNAFDNSSENSNETHENKDFLEKIELLTTATHDSDSSTILICSCDQRKGNRDKKLRKLTENSGIFKLKENSGILDLEDNSGILDLEDNSGISNSEEHSGISNLEENSGILNFPENSGKLNFPENSGILNLPKNSGNTYRFNAKSVTIGTQVLAGSAENDGKIDRKIPGTRSRCHLPIFIPSDDEDNSFTKIFENIQSKSENRLTDSRKTRVLVTSSDDEDDDIRESGKKRVKYYDTRGGRSNGHETRTKSSENQRKSRKIYNSGTFGKIEENSEGYENSYGRRGQDGKFNGNRRKSDENPEENEKIYRNRGKAGKFKKLRENGDDSSEETEEIDDSRGKAGKLNGNRRKSPKSDENSEENENIYRNRRKDGKFKKLRENVDENSEETEGIDNSRGKAGKFNENRRKSPKSDENSEENEKIYRNRRKDGKFKKLRENIDENSEETEGIDNSRGKAGKFNENRRKSPKSDENSEENEKIYRNRRKDGKFKKLRENIDENSEETEEIDNSRGKTGKFNENRRKSPKSDENSEENEKIYLNRRKDGKFKKLRENIDENSEETEGIDNSRGKAGKFNGNREENRKIEGHSEEINENRGKAGKFNGNRAKSRKIHENSKETEKMDQDQGKAGKFHVNREENGKTDENAAKTGKIENIAEISEKTGKIDVKTGKINTLLDESNRRKSESDKQTKVKRRSNKNATDSNRRRILTRSDFKRSTRQKLSISPSKNVINRKMGKKSTARKENAAKNQNAVKNLSAKSEDSAIIENPAKDQNALKNLSANSEDSAITENSAKNQNAVKNSSAKKENAIKNRNGVKNSKEENTAKNDNAVKNSSSRRENSAKNLPASNISSPEVETSSKTENPGKVSSLGKAARNIFADSNSPDAPILWQDLKLALEDNSEISLRFTKRSSKIEPKILRNSLRFRTRLDEDSDAEFEGLKFSLNEKYFRKELTNISDDSEKTEKMKKEGKINDAKIQRMEIDEPKNLRTSPRRSAAIDSSPKIRKIVEKRRNLFADQSKKSQTENFENFWNNNINDNNSVLSLEIKATQNSPEKTKKKPKEGVNKSHNLRNLEAPKNRGKFKKNSTGAKMPKIRRLRIVANRNVESEDDSDFNDPKTASTERNPRLLDSLINSDASKRKKDARDEEASQKSKQFTRNIFPTSPEDSPSDGDFFFGKITKSPTLSPVLNQLKFTTRKYNNFANSVSGISFRTRLRSDTDDEGDL